MYSKTCVKWTLKKKTKIGFQDRIMLNAGQKYCRIRLLQYFRPSLSHHLSLRSLFCQFLSGRLRQVLYISWLPMVAGITGQFEGSHSSNV